MKPDKTNPVPSRNPIPLKHGIGFNPLLQMHEYRFEPIVTHTFGDSSTPLIIAASPSRFALMIEIITGQNQISIQWDKPVDDHIHWSWDSPFPIYISAFNYPCLPQLSAYIRCPQNTIIRVSELVLS